MAIQPVGIGLVVNDGGGDPLRTAYSKINDNFADPTNAASKLVGPLPTNVPTNADLPTFGTAAEADTGLATGQVPTADDMGMVGETVNYHGGNYQPTDPVGLGVAKLMANASGGTIPPGGTMVGQGLQQVAVLSTGGIAAGSSGGTGNIWLNDSDLNIGNGNAATFTRIS